MSTSSAPVIVSSLGPRGLRRGHALLLLAVAVCCVLLALPIWSMVAYGWAVWVLYTVAYALAAVRQARQPLVGEEWFGWGILPLLAALVTFGAPLAGLLVGVGALLAGALQTTLDRKPGTTPRQAIRLLLETAGRIALVGGVALFTGTSFFLALGGPLPLTAIAWSTVPALLVLLVSMAVARASLLLALDGRGDQAVGRVLARRLLTRVLAECAAAAPALLLALAFFNLDRLSFAALLGAILAGLLLWDANTRAQRGLQCQLDDLLGWRTLSEALADTLTPQDVCRAIQQQVDARLDAPLFYVALIDAERQMLRFPLVIEAGVLLSWPVRPRARRAGPESTYGPVEHVLQTKAPLLLTAAQTEAQTLGIEGTGWIEPCASLLAMPLFSHDTVIGVVVVQHPVRPAAYSAADRDWLAAVAVQSGVTMRSARLRMEAQRLADELTLINRVSSLVSTSLDLQAILQQLCQLALQVSGVHRAFVFLQDGEQKQFVPAHHAQLSEAGAAALQASTLPLDHPWTACADLALPVVIPDVVADPDSAPLQAFLAGEEVASVMLVPLMSLRSIVNGMTYTPHHDLIGLLVVGFPMQSTPLNGTSSLLSTVANQAAVAIENAHLFDETQSAVKRLAYLAEATRIFSRSLDLDEVTYAVVDWIVDALDLDFGALTLWNHEQDLLLVQAIKAGRRLLEPVDESAFSFAPGDVPEVDELLRHRWAQVYRVSPANVDAALSPALLARCEAARVQVMILVPLVAHDTVIGLLLLGQVAPHAPAPSDINLAEAIAGQAAAAIQNANFYSLTESALADRLVEIGALEQVLQRISASVDETLVIQEVLDAAQLVTRATVLACALLKLDGSWRFMWRTADETTLRSLVRPALTRGVINRVSQSRQPALIDDTTQDPDYFNPSNWPETLSELAVPIIYEDDLLGVINVESATCAAFTSYHVRFLQNLAHHAANAIVRARLFEARRRQIAMLESIRVLSVDLLENPSLETVLARVCETALGIANGENVHVYFYDAETEALTFAASLWFDGRRDVEVAVPRPNGLTRQGIRARKPLVSEDFQNVAGTVTTRLGVFPLHHQNMIVGVLNVAVSDAAYLDEEVVRALDLLANQTAVAITRVRLFESRQRELEMLDALRMVSLRLLDALDLETVLEIVCRSALMIVQAADVHLYFYEADSDTLTFAASLWADGRRNQEGWTPRPEGVTRQTARSGQSAIQADSKRVYPGTGETMSTIVLGVPLKHAGQVIGVLNVALKEQDAIGDDVIWTLELLADQAAAAVRNVRLFEAVRDARDRMQVILETVRDGLALVDRRGVLVQVNPTLSAMMGQPMEPLVGQYFLRALVKLGQNDPGLVDAFSHGALQDLRQSLDDAPDGLTHRELKLTMDEQVRYFEEESAPVLAEDGHIIGRLFIWRDTTHAHVLDEARAELTNTIVHDLRSPLTAIKGGITMLLELGYEESGADLMEEILSVAENSADSLLAMVESMLDVARLERGELPLMRVTASLADPVGQAVSLLNVLAQENQIALRADLPPDLPLLDIDTDQVRRVLINLVDNALRYTPAGGSVTVQAAVIEGGAAVRCCVVDTGPGVPQEARELVFSAYQTGITGAPRRGTKGLGLGLTFCKLSVEAHGGRIWVEDAPGGGAAFCVTLPVSSETSMMQGDTASVEQPG